MYPTVNAICNTLLVFNISKILNFHWELEAMLEGIFKEITTENFSELENDLMSL